MGNRKDIMEFRVSACILAAGCSSRMGKPKQLLELGGKPLLEHVIHLTLTGHFSEIYTVIGHDAETIRQTIRMHDPRFRWVVNADYRKGQSSSLKLAVGNMCDPVSTMIFLADQPLISIQTVNTLYERAVITLFTGQKKPFIIRPSYRGIPGHPVFLGNVPKKHFLSLHGDRGAKQLIARIPQYEIIRVDDDGVSFDIDTPYQYEQAKKRFLIQK